MINKFFAISTLLIFFSQLLMCKSFASPKKYALVIGITDYKTNPDLKYAREDAHFFSKILTRFCDISEKDVICLVDSEATYININKAMARINPKRDDTVILYFSGHGSQKYYDDNVKNEIICFGDYHPDSSTTYLSDIHLKALITEYWRHANVVIILDCCHSIGEESYTENRGYPEEFSRDLAFWTILGASAVDQKARTYFTDQHGLFTYFLSQGIIGFGESNRNGKISIGEAFDYAKKNVMDFTREEKRNPQTPQIYGDSTLIVDKYFSKRLFSQNVSSPAFFKISEIKDNHLKLDLGLRHGLIKDFFNKDSLLVISPYKAANDNAGVNHNKSYRYSCVAKAIVDTIYNENSMADIVFRPGSHQIKKNMKVIDSRLSGFLIINSEPGEAEVVVKQGPKDLNPSIYNRAIGVTPLKLDYIPTGRWEFELHKDGYFVSNLEVSANSLEIITALDTLKQRPGKISLDSTPNDVEVSLNNFTLPERTPIDEYPFPPNEYLLRLDDPSRSEYDPFFTKIRIKENEPFKKHYNLPEVSVHSKIDELIIDLLPDYAMKGNHTVRINLLLEHETIEEFNIANQVDYALKEMMRKYLTVITDEHQIPEFEISGKIYPFGNELVVEIEFKKFKNKKPESQADKGINKKLFVADNKNVLWPMIIFPGFGRIYERETILGSILTSGTILFVSGFFYFGSKENDAKNAAKRAYEDYSKEINSDLTSKYYKQHRDNIDDANCYRTWKYVALGSYLGIFVHELLWTNSIVSEYNKKKEKFSIQVEGDKISLGLNIKL